MESERDFLDSVADFVGAKAAAQAAARKRLGLLPGLEPNEARLLKQDGFMQGP
jgi:hypothetical protein